VEHICIVGIRAVSDSKDTLFNNHAFTSFYSLCWANSNSGFLRATTIRKSCRLEIHAMAYKNSKTILLNGPPSMVDKGNSAPFADTTWNPFCSSKLKNCRFEK